MDQPRRGGGAACRVPGPDPAKCCVFYGWVILAVSIAVRIVGTAGTLRMITFVVPGTLGRRRRCHSRLSSSAGHNSSLYRAGRGANGAF